MYMHGTDASPAGYFAVIQRSWDFPEQFNALQPYDKALQSTSHHTSYSLDTPVFQLVQANTHGGICGNDGTSLGSTATQRKQTMMLDSSTNSAAPEGICLVLGHHTSQGPSIVRRRRALLRIIRTGEPCVLNSALSTFKWSVSPLSKVFVLFKPIYFMYRI